MTGHVPEATQDSNCPACFHLARFNSGPRPPLAETGRLDRLESLESLEEFRQLVQSRCPDRSEWLLKPAE